MIWEEYLDEVIYTLEFKDVDTHRSVFWHPELLVRVVVYAGDIKIAGPEENCREV